MTAADRNTTADALDQWADADEANARNYSFVSTASTLHERASDLRVAARLLRTPDTPTGSDTAARARALLDADPTNLAGRCVDEAAHLQRTRSGRGETIGALSEAAVTLQQSAALITDLLAMIQRGDFG